MKYKLHEVFEFIRNGANIKQGIEGGYPITRIETISDRYINRDKMGYAGIYDLSKYEDYLLKDGDILMSHINSEIHLGKSAIYQKKDPEEKIIHGMNLLCLRPNPKIIFPKYVFYYFNTHFFKMKLNKIIKKSVNQASFSVTDLKKIEIDIPNIDIQIKIANTLDKAQELIDKRNAQIEALDQLTQSVFLEMFGDPINTKWKTEKLSEITDVRDGTHDSPKYIQKGYPLVTSKNIKDGEIDLTNVNYISEEDYEKINQRSKVDIGDIIMPMIGTIGNPVIVNVEPNFAIKNVALIKFYPDTCIINIYLKYLLDSHYLDFVLSKNRRGGTQKFLSLKNIRNMEIPVPPIKLQKDFTKVIREINEKKKLLNKSLDEMVNAYNSIIQRAFKGELFTEDKVPNH